MGETWNNIKDNAGTALTNMSTLWTTFWTDVSVRNLKLGGNRLLIM